MPIRIRSLWREPLLHFLLIGLALFIYYDLIGDNAEVPAKRIHVERGQVQQLASNFERTWSRAPTQQELDAMIEGHVREEVFYREALALGLDRDDPMVRRRMRMKLEFMLEDLSAQDYSDEVLNDYLQRHADKFRQQPQISFRQVYLDPDKRPQLRADAERLLASLNAGANPQTLGDPTLAPRAYQQARKSEIARDFGDEFADQLVKLKPGEWGGPVYSPFGAHLLQVDQRTDARQPALAEIRDQVLREYRVEQRTLQKDVAYQKLREGYEVTIEPLPSATANATPKIAPEANAGATQ